MILLSTTEGLTSVNGKPLPVEPVVLLPFALVTNTPVVFVEVLSVALFTGMELLDAPAVNGLPIVESV